jgi:hypothetical protein
MPRHHGTTRPQSPSSPTMSDLTLQQLQAALANAEVKLAKAKADQASADVAIRRTVQQEIDQFRKERVLSLKPKIETLRKERETQLYLSIAAVILVAGLALAFPVFSAHQEAAAYNRITNGPHVTTWEALFLELRVEACNSQR